MTSKELWEQLVVQRVIEAIKPNLPTAGDLEDEEEAFMEQLSPEHKETYEKLREHQVLSVFDEQKMIYECGFMDGLRVGHAAF